MINIEATIKCKGYNPDELSQGSQKRVWAVCDDCGKGRWVIYCAYRNLCKSCSQKGRIFSKEHCKKISKGQKGKIISKETRLKMSAAHKGHIVSEETREKIGAGNKGKIISKETRLKISEANKGHIVSTESRNKISMAKKGHIVSTESRNKISMANKGKSHSKKTRQKLSEFRKGKNNPFYGKTHSDKSRQRLSATNQGIPYEEWESYAKEQPYCPAFNKACRESNRDKYDRQCFICGLHENKNITKTGISWKLSVHHVDMNKQMGCDGHSWKLVPLCLHCHGKTHTDLWDARITYLLNNSVAHYFKA